MSTSRKRSPEARTRARKRERHNQRVRIYERDRGCCQYCGVELVLGNITVDHVVPLAVAHCNATENQVLACVSCNHAKGNHLPPRELPLLIVQRAWRAIDGQDIAVWQRASRRVAAFWAAWDKPATESQASAA